MLGRPTEISASHLAIAARINFESKPPVPKVMKLMPPKPGLNSCRYCHEKDMTKPKLDKHLHETHSFPRCEMCQSVYQTLSIISSCFQMSHFCNLKFKFECKIKDCKLQNKTMEDLDNMVAHLYNVHGLNTFDGLVETLLNQRKIDTSDQQLMLNLKSNPGEFRFMQYCADKASELHYLKKYADGVSESHYEPTGELSRKALHDNYNTLVLADKATYREFIPGNMNPFDFQIGPSPQFIESHVWAFLHKMNQMQENQTSISNKVDDKSVKKKPAHPFAAGLMDSTIPTKLSKLCVTCCHFVTKSLRETKQAADVELCFRCQTELGMNLPEEGNPDPTTEVSNQNNQKASTVKPSTAGIEAKEGELKPKRGAKVAPAATQPEVDDDKDAQATNPENEEEKKAGSKNGSGKYKAMTGYSRPSGSGRNSQIVQTPEQKLQSSLEMCRLNPATVVRNQMPNPVLFHTEFEAQCPQIFMHIPVDHHKRKKKERSLLSKRLTGSAKADLDSNLDMEASSRNDFMQSQKPQQPQFGGKVKMNTSKEKPIIEGSGLEPDEHKVRYPKVAKPQLQRPPHTGLSNVSDSSASEESPKHMEPSNMQPPSTTTGTQKSRILVDSSQPLASQQSRSSQLTQGISQKAVDPSSPRERPVHRSSTQQSANGSTGLALSTNNTSMQSAGIKQASSRQKHPKQAISRENSANRRDETDKRNKKPNRAVGHVIDVD